MELQSFLSKNKKLLIVTTFFIINTLSICLIFNTEFFYTKDLFILNTKFILITVGIGFFSFFITLKFLDSLTISKLFLIFIITRLVIFSYLTILNYGLELDVSAWWEYVAQKVLDGHSLYEDWNEVVYYDRWRLTPPLVMWWYALNYLIHGLNPFFWRLINILLEIGIVYVMYKIFKEIKINEQYFKIGLSFYIFSIFPIHGIVLYGNYIAFPLLLGLLGILFYLKSRNDENYIYLAILFLTLNALSSYYGAIWILGIFLLLLFRKKFSLLFVLIIEVIAIFSIVALPMLINDLIGYLQRLTWIYQIDVKSVEFFLTIWYPAFDYIEYIPALIALCSVVLYTYLNRDKKISLDFFAITLSMFLIFTPSILTWYLLWIFTLISIDLIYSFRKYFTTSTLFLLFLYIHYLFFAIAFLLNPPDSLSYLATTRYMDEIGLMLILRTCGHLFFQLGLIFLIYAYTKQKRWVIILITPFIIYYTLFFIFGL